MIILSHSCYPGVCYGDITGRELEKINGKRWKERMKENYGDKICEVEENQVELHAVAIFIGQKLEYW